MAKKMDRAKQYIDEIYEKYENSRKYVQITIHKFLFLKLVVVQVDKGYEAKLFRNGVEEFAYWMAVEPRRAFVAKMMKAGMKQTIIAKCFKLSTGTITKDVAWLRDNQPWLLEGVKLRPRRGEEVVTPRRVSRTTQTGLTLQ